MQHIKQTLDEYKGLTMAQFNTYKKITTPEQARDYAIEWQRKAQTQDLSYLELAQDQVLLEKLANKYNLTEEFKENAII
jgi:hypothetical protein